MGLFACEVCLNMKMAGVAGFEPAHTATKKRCLTAWPHPNIFKIRPVIVEWPYIILEMVPSHGLEPRT